MNKYYLNPLKIFVFILLLLSTTTGYSQENNDKAQGYILLVGVSTYKPGTLSDLPNPCKDITAIKDVLNAVPNLKLFSDKCDLSSSEIRKLVNDFYDFLGSQEDGVYGVIYFSGHGISLDENIYLFGSKTVLSVEEVKNRRKKRARPSGELMTHFPRENALSLFDDLTPGQAAGNPVIIVLDACRSISLGTNLNAMPAGSGMLQIAPTVDTLIAFSAAHGSESLDQIAGLDISPYAAAFRDALKDSDISASDFFSQVRRNLRKNLDTTITNRKRQQPAELNSLESRVCIGKCDPCSAGKSASLHEMMRKTPDRRLFESSSTLQTVLLAANEGFTMNNAESFPQKNGKYSSTAWSIDTDPALLKKLMLKRASTMRLDVFWCDSRNSQNNYIRASDASKVISDFAEKGELISGAMLSSIRIRRLSEEINTTPGYELNRDVIRYDPGSETETQWTSKLRTLLVEKFDIILPTPASTKTPGYMSLFFCESSPHKFTTDN